MKSETLYGDRLDAILAKTSLACCIVLGISAIFAISLLQARSISYFNQSPFDGVFQTLFPLRKMDAGEMPGRDFYYFHGNGIPYLLYPFYRIALIFSEGELSASMAATYFVNTIFLIAPIFYACRLFMGIRASLITTMLFSICVENLPVFGYFFSPNFIGAPMAVRMFPHIAMAIAIGTVATRVLDDEANYFTTLKRLAIVGAIGAVMPLLGAEQGFYAVASAAGASFFLGGRKWNIAQRLSFMSILLVAFFVGFIVTQLAFFGSMDTFAAIKDISQNQVWVYGVFPNGFFATWSEVFSLKLSGAVPSQAMTVAGTLSLLGCIVLFFLRILTLPALFLILVLFAGGVLSWVANLGYVGQHQAPLFLRECIFAIAFTVVAIVSKFTRTPGKNLEISEQH